MALKQQIQNDVKEAMKQKNQEMVDILRMAVASINAKQTEKRYKLAKDNPGKAEEELIKVLQEEILFEEWAGVHKGSEAFIKSDIFSLIELAKRLE